MLKKGVEPFAKIRRIRRYGLVVESVSLRVGFEVSKTHARHILCHSAYELGYKTSLSPFLPTYCCGPHHDNDRLTSETVSKPLMKCFLL